MCLISPGAVRTPIWTKSGDDAAALLAGAPAEAETLYGRLIRQVLPVAKLCAVALWVRHVLVGSPRHPCAVLSCFLCQTSLWCSELSVAITGAAHVLTLELHTILRSMN